MIPRDSEITYYLIGARPFAVCRRSDGLPFKAIGYDMASHCLRVDAGLFITADTDPDAEEITEDEFWVALRKLGCHDRRISW